MSPISYSSRRAVQALTVLSLLFGGTAVTAPAQQAMAQGVITSTNKTIATVETLDPDTGEILLRTDDGDLFTIDVPHKRHALPHVDVGDRLQITSVKMLDAALAQPGTPEPESTTSTARGYANRHPHGTLVSFRRRRVRVVSTNPQQHLLTVTDASGMPREVVINRKIFYPLLQSLKAGDEVDVTTMESVSYTVLNRTVTPNVVVEQKTGAPDASVPAPAPVAPAAPATTGQ